MDSDEQEHGSVMPVVAPMVGGSVSGDVGVLPVEGAQPPPPPSGPSNPPSHPQPQPQPQSNPPQQVPPPGPSQAATEKKMHTVFDKLPYFSTLFAAQLVDLRPLQGFGPSVEEAGRLVAGFPPATKGIVTCTLGGVEATVCFEALTEREMSFPKPQWHSSPLKLERREFSARLQGRLWAEMADYLASISGQVREALTQPDSRGTFIGKYLESQCFTLERGIYYAAENLADYLDETKLVARVAMLHAFQWRGYSLRRLQAEAEAKNAQALFVPIHAGIMGALKQPPPPPHPPSSSSSSLAPKPQKLENPSSWTARLKILGHVKYCPVPRGTHCPSLDFPACDDYKSLFFSKHFNSCDSLDCGVPHCASSRLSMSHLAGCPSRETCPVCVEVRPFLAACRSEAAARKGGEEGRGDSQAKRPRVMGEGGMAPPPSAPLAGGAAGAAGGGGGALQPAQDPVKVLGMGTLGECVLKEKDPAGGAEAVKLRKKTGTTTLIKKHLFDGYCSFLGSMKKGEIVEHMLCMRDEFNSFIDPDTMANKIFTPILDCLKDWKVLNPDGKLVCPYEEFLNPVDPVRSALPTYFEEVKRPMEFATIRYRVQARDYKTFKAFGDDVRLVFNNAIKYWGNGEDRRKAGWIILEWARTLLGKFNKVYSEQEADYLNIWSQRRNDNRYCSVCAGTYLYYEPPLLHCNECAKRIKKGAKYWTNKSNKYHWCTPCFKEVLPKGGEIMVENGTVLLSKSELLEKKHVQGKDENEWLVQCDNCLRWQHQVCSLFNSKRVSHPDTPHYCPTCVLNGIMPLPPPKNEGPLVPKHTKVAVDLPQCALSQHIELRMRGLLESRRADLERSGETVPTLTIRVVYNAEKVFLTQPQFYSRYGPLGFPSQQNYRSKAIVLFQRLRGVDTLLYTVFLQEFGDDPGPNRRTVYLSYLDSVKYLEPAHLRTDVYREILAAYVEDIRDRGFNQLNLWSCPPQKGDDYILHVHPEEQKTPKADLLREWYVRLLEECQRRGMVEKMVLLADEMAPSVCGSEGGTDKSLLHLPYLEGDYLPATLESEIRRMKEAGTLTPYGELGPSAKAAKAALEEQRAAEVAAVAAAEAKAKAAAAAAALQVASESVAAAVAAAAAVTSGGVLSSSSLLSEGGGGSGGMEGVEGGNDEDIPMTLVSGATSLDATTLTAALSIAPTASITGTGGGGGGVAPFSAHGGIKALKPNRKPKKQTRGWVVGGGGGGGGAGGVGGGGGGAFALGGSGGDVAAGVAAGTIPLSHTMPGVMGGPIMRRRATPIGPDGFPLPADEVRFDISDKLIAMRFDFLVAKLRPFCQLCKRYFSGSKGVLDVMYHCNTCDTVPSPPTVPPAKRPGCRPPPSDERRPTAKFNLCQLCYDMALAEEEEEEQQKQQQQLQLGGEAGTAGDGSSSSSSSSGSGRGRGGERVGGWVTQKVLPLLSHHLHPIKDLVAVSVKPAKGLVFEGKSEGGGSSSGSGSGSGSGRASSSSSTSTSSLLSPFKALGDDGSLVDPNPVIESNFWKSRQLFLNLCQGNHYQFDQIRRARYSSIMLLYHMHFPYASSFIHSCNACGKSIDGEMSEGGPHHTVRHSCTVCEEFDMCAPCAAKMGKGIGFHEHPLVEYRVKDMGDIDLQKELRDSEEARKEKEALRLSELLHVSSCTGSGCTSPLHAPSMVALVAQAATCAKARAPPSSPLPPPTFLSDCTCTSCKELRTLALLHSRVCKRMEVSREGYGFPAVTSGGGGGGGTQVRPQHPPPPCCLVPGCAQAKNKARTVVVANSMDARRRAFANDTVAAEGKVSTTISSHVDLDGKMVGKGLVMAGGGKGGGGGEEEAGEGEGGSDDGTTAAGGGGYG